MIKVINNQDIEYTHGDTFSLTIYPTQDGVFEAGMQLRLIIAVEEGAEHIIDKKFDINEDLTFTLTLNDTEKGMLPIRDYKYKLSTYKNNTIVTEMSGEFIVKWGA